MEWRKGNTVSASAWIEAMENVFGELKNPWGFSGFCSQKAAVSQSSARLLLLIYNLWSLFVRVLKNQGSHTEAIKSRYELLLIPAKMVLSGRRKIVKLAVGSKPISGWSNG